MKLKNKILAVFSMVSALALSFALPASAASELPSEVVVAYTEGVGGISDSIFQVIGIAFPVAISIVAVVIAIKFGIKFVRGLIGR